MFKISLLITGMFVTLNLGGLIDALGAYNNLILGGLLALLVSPWVARQLR